MRRVSTTSGPRDGNRRGETLLVRGAMQSANLTSLRSRDVKSTWSFVNRDLACQQNMQRMMSARIGVTEHVRSLEAAMQTFTESVRQPSPGQRADSTSLPQPSIAVLVRGQTYRGVMRETFRIDGMGRVRKAAQRDCLRSLVQHIFEPYERHGHVVDVFLTVYKDLGGPMDELLAPFGDRVATITTVVGRTSTQLLPLGAAVREFLSWCRRYKPEGYEAVVVTRFDVLIKTDIHALLGDARLVDGFRLLWREAGGHWRHHSDSRTSARTFMTHSRLDWRRGNPRAPDALLAFPYAYTGCFLASTRNEFFPIRNESRPLSFMHNMVPALRRALPFFTEHHTMRPRTDGPLAPAGVPSGMQYLVRGQFDSNPCRATCMLNPVYDFLPRMRWVSSSAICQSSHDFAYDDKSDSLCCPSPNYCCPNSLNSCASPGAVLFDVVTANVSKEAIVAHWPLQQARPFRWLMTERSFRYVANAWRQGARKSDAELQRLQPLERPDFLRAKLRKAALTMMQVREATQVDCVADSPKADSTLCRGR